jgi:hypothetical protein
MNTRTLDLAHELWAIAQSPSPVEEVVPIMVAVMERGKTGLRNLDSTLSLMDRSVNILGMEGSRMDWDDLMEWQRVLLGHAPTDEPAPIAPKPVPFKVAGLPDPQHNPARVWGASEGDE